MASPAFYNDNLYRAYPFQTVVNATSLPQSLIVDVGCIMYTASVFSAAGYLYLQAVWRDGNTVYLDLRCSTLPTWRCLFSRDVGCELFVTEWQTAENTADGGLAACDSLPPWEAFLVTGDLSELQLAASESLTLPAELWRLEPGRVQNLADTYVQSINLANFARTRVTAPAGCDPIETDVEIRPAGVCLQGDVRFKEGFNCLIRQDASTNAISINGSKQAGEGQPCSEFPLWDGEEKPAGSQLFSGGPICSEVIRTINGVGSRNMLLRAGRNVRIYPDAAVPHTLVIERRY